LQLADVARPVGGRQQLDGFGRVDLALPGLLGDLLEEVRDQQRDVLAPARQRRHLDVHDVEAVVEVLAERAGHHQLLQVAVRGRDHAHVRPACSRCCRPAGPVLLQHAQQLDLQRIGMSPISSSISVPPSAAWNRPRCCGSRR
jgi:hypothetical protein